jgi:hypothetical protein
LVEREPSKLGVAGSSPVSRSNLRMTPMADSRWPVPFWRTQPHEPLSGYAQVAQSVEHVLGKDEVGGSIPLLGLCPDQIKVALRPGFTNLNKTVQPLTGKPIVGGSDEQTEI